MKKVNLIALIGMGAATVGGVAQVLMLKALLVPQPPIEIPPMPHFEALQGTAIMEGSFLEPPCEGHNKLGGWIESCGELPGMVGDDC